MKHKKKHEEKGVMRKHRKLFSILLSIVVILIALGVSLTGFYISQKSKKLDLKRQEDLRDIVTKYQIYLTHNPVPPKSLEELYGYYSHFIDNNESTNPPVDPQTKKKYQYKELPDGSYQICADFASETDTKVFGYSGITDGNGNKCFIVSTKSTPGTQASPAASLAASAVVSVKREESCRWGATFSLKGFAPNSPIKIRAHGTLSDGCDPAKTHPYEWEHEAVLETGEDGGGQITYAQYDYGNYTYEFSDPTGRHASTSFYYTTTAIPASNH
jgi:hypothetical protein